MAAPGRTATTTDVAARYELTGASVGGSEAVGTLPVTRCALVVLGSHRGGTSALAGLAHLLGASAPKHLVEPTPANPLGSWQSERVRRLNQRIMESGGSSWRDWTELSSGWLSSPAAGDFCQGISRILHEEYSESPFFVLTDPAISRLSGLWIPELQRVEAAIRVAVTVRNPLETALSLQEHDGIPLHEGLLIWMRDLLDAEFGTRGVDRCFVSYDDVMRDWRMAAGRISRRLGFAWPRLSPSVEFEIDEFVRPDQRHFAVSSAELRERSDIGDLLKRCYDALEPACSDDELGLHAQHVLDAVRAEFNQGSEWYGRIVTRRGARIAELDNSVRAAGSRIAALEDLVAQRDGQLGEVREFADGRVARIGDLEGAVARRDARIAALEDLVAQRDGQLGEVREFADGRVARIGDLEGAVARRDTRIGEMEGLLEEWHSHINAMAGTAAGEQARVAERTALLRDGLAEDRAPSGGSHWARPQGLRAPNFFVAGTQKSGTSYLCAVLAEHPQVFMSARKEPMYFNRGSDGDEAYSRYLSEHFAASAEEHWVGEGSTLYFQSHSAPWRIRRRLGSKLRFIVSVRHPIEKAVSLYMHDYRKRRLSGDERLSDPGLRLTLERSRYADAAKSYLRLFGRRQVTFLDFADLRSTPGAFVQQALHFLELEPVQRIRLRPVNVGIPMVVRDGRLMAAEVGREGSDRPVPRFPLEELESLLPWFAEDTERFEELSQLDLSAWRRLPTWEADSPQG